MNVKNADWLKKFKDVGFYNNTETCEDAEERRGGTFETFDFIEVGLIFGMKNDFTSTRILNALFCKIGKRAVAEKDNLVLFNFIHRRTVQDYF